MEEKKIPKFTDTCVDGVYEITFEVTPQMADENGRMRIGDLTRQMQRATEGHFDRYAGLTGEELRQLGITWVIAWSDIQSIRLPNIGEHIILRTWAGKNRAALYTRKYAMYGGDGEPLMTTASLFLLMDQTTRSMAQQPKQMKDISPVLVEGEPKPPKMKQKMPAEFTQNRIRTVKPEEIDFNGHLNNAHYLDWAEELLEDDLRRSQEPKHIWIEYARELQKGASVSLSYTWEDQTMYLVGEHEDQTVFSMILSF